MKEDVWEFSKPRIKYLLHFSAHVMKENIGTKRDSCLLVNATLVSLCPHNLRGNEAQENRNIIIFHRERARLCFDPPCNRGVQVFNVYLEKCLD